VARPHSRTSAGDATPNDHRSRTRDPDVDGHGLSNHEVAQRLTLSKRTVESHLYHAMATSRTTSRDRFAAPLRKRISLDGKPGRMSDPTYQSISAYSPKTPGAYSTRFGTGSLKPSLRIGYNR
jgi:hypothetical protein